MNEKILRLFSRQSPVSVLGPGQRAVIWVQGCRFACKNCIVPESWPLKVRLPDH
ncbi:MAG: radical SAM protein [Microcoleus sp. SIO2G3]|nr:radical SAM protein [Microcoleus sp. SIO2G3]